MVVTFPDIKAKQLANKKYIGAKVLLGIRPEHVHPAQGNLKAYIDVVEHLGDESILYCKMENRKEQFIIKIPFNSKIRANEETKVEFDMEHVYLFDAETHKAIMGIPAEDEIAVNIKDNVLSIGEQSIVLDEEYAQHLLDSSFNNEVTMAIKPEYISEEETPNALKVVAKFEFVEQKTDYQAVYFSLKGVEGYYAMKVKNGEEIKLGKEVVLYMPYQRINIYDKEHNKTNSREVVYPNKGMATISNAKGQMQVKVAGATLTYPEEDLESGEYEIVFKQDKMLPIFPKKMLKKDYVNPEMENPKNRIKVSAYDEDVLGNNLLVYVQLNGFEKYSSFVMPNNFSVYKLPKFELYVPRDAFELIAKK